MSFKRTDNRQLICRAAYFDGDNKSLWIVTALSSFLIRIDMEKRIICEYYQIPFSTFSEYNCISMTKFGDKLYFAPYNAKEFLVFSLTTHCFDKLSILLDENEKIKPGKFFYIGVFNNKIYYLGCFLHEIISYDVNTSVVMKIKVDNEEGRLCSGNVIAKNNKLIIPELEKNKVLFFDFGTDKFEEKIVSYDSNYGFSAAFLNDNELELISLDGYKITCNIDINDIRTYKINADLEFNDDYFYCAYRLGKSDYFFPLKTNKIFKISSELNGIEPIKKFEYLDCDNIGSDWSKYELIYRTKDFILFQTRSNGYFYEIMENGTIKQISVDLPSEINVAMQGACTMSIKNIIYEDGIRNIYGLLKGVSEYGG